MLKRIADLNFDEVLKIALHSEEYHRLIDFECAHLGISLLPDYPGSQPVVAEFKPDLMIYKIGSWGFTTIEAAQAVFNAITSHNPCREVTSKGISVLKPITSDDYYWPKIESQPVFSEIEYESIKADAEFANLELSAWKEKKKEYDRVENERKDVVKAFSKKREHALKVTAGVLRIAQNLKRYLELAQGSYPIAIGFLKEADKHGSVHLEGEDVYYCCTNGQQHFVISREVYQNNKMHEALGVTA